MRKKIYYLIILLLTLNSCEKENTNELLPEEIYTNEVKSIYKNYFSEIVKYKEAYSLHSIDSNKRAVVGINGRELFLGIALNANLVTKGTLNLPAAIDNSYVFYKGEVFSNALGTFVLHFKKKDKLETNENTFKTIIINGEQSIVTSQLYAIEDIISSDELPNIDYLYRDSEGHLDVIYNSALYTYSWDGHYIISYPYKSKEDPIPFLEGKPIIVKTVNHTGDLYDKPILADAVNANIIFIELQSVTKDKLWVKDFTVSDWILKEGENRYNTSFLYDLHSFIRIDTRENGMKYNDGSEVLRPYKRNTSIYIDKVSGSIFQTKEF